MSSWRFSRPGWLASAVDMAVDSSGRVFTLRGDGTLWLHDASGDQQVADLSALSITDMDVGPDDLVYIASGNTIYRLDAQGSPILYATLPADATSIFLDASSWGLVAASSNNTTFYRIEATGAASAFYSLGYGFGSFAVDPQGTVCYQGEGWECRRTDGTVESTVESTDSADFGTLPRY